MLTVLFSFIFFVFIVAAMSVGVLMGRKPVSGSCGGLAAVDGMGECEICGGNPAKCEEENPMLQEGLNRAETPDRGDDKYYSA